MEYENRFQWLRAKCPLIDEYRKFEKVWETMSGRNPYGGTCIYCHKDGVTFGGPQSGMFYCQDCQKCGDIFTVARLCLNLAPLDFVDHKCKQLGIKIPQEVLEQEKSGDQKRYRERLAKAEAIRKEINSPINRHLINHKLAHLKGASELLSNLLEEGTSYDEFLEALIAIVKANLCRLEDEPPKNDKGQ